MTFDNTVTTKEKRSKMRIPVLHGPLEVETLAWTEALEYDNISATGIFIKSEKLPAPHTTVYLRIKLPGDLGTLGLTGNVVRTNWIVNKKKNLNHKGFAVQFFEPSPTTQKILDAYLNYVRNKQIIDVSKRIIEEFFGAGPRPTH